MWVNSFGRAKINFRIMFLSLSFQMEINDIHICVYLIKNVTYIITFCNIQTRQDKIDLGKRETERVCVVKGTR